jgi:hypothetical protein
MTSTETPDRIEPVLVDEIPPPVADAIAELSAATAIRLFPRLYPES